MTDKTLTFMAVHAHPDDEATGTGGVFARCAAEGIQTVLVTCTDGRCGDGANGVKPGEAGHDPAAVVQMRRGELQASCRVLDISHLELLGYGDSGMMGWAANDAPDAFWATPVEEAAARLAELMGRYQPDVVVTYDPNGFYGHPDHIQAHRVTMAALKLTGLPAKVYWTTAPRSMIEEFGRVMTEFGADWDEPDVPAEATDEASTDGPAQPQIEIGLPDEQITTWVDTKEFGDQKYDSLLAHASQSDSTPFLRMGRERFIKLMSMETFVRVDGPASTDREDDLFAGLR